MREVQIVGAGAIGSLFGYLLAKAGCDVLLVARGKRLEELKRGLIIDGLVKDRIDVEFSSRPERAWLTIFAVKSYDTEEAARTVEDTELALSVQNGIGNEDVISKYVDRVLGGVTSYAANIRDGVVFYAGRGVTWIGNWKGCSREDVEEVARVLGKAMDVRVAENIVEMKWRKAAINAVINPLTAITGMRNGAITKELWGAAKPICRECERVLESMGYRVNVEEEVRRVAELTAENRSSMLQDVERGKKTEIDAITGKFVEEGRKRGIDVRANELVYHLVRAIEGKVQK